MFQHFLRVINRKSLHRVKLCPSNWSLMLVTVIARTAIFSNSTKEIFLFSETKHTMLKPPLPSETCQQLIHLESI
jgi:hypothetical protein